MDLDLSILFFFVLIAVWGFLPFAPAFCELWTMKDHMPIDIVRDSEVDIRYFAASYFRFIEANLAPELSRCRDEGRPCEGQLADGSAFLVVPGVSGEPLSVGGPATPCRKMVLSCSALELPPGGVYLVELYAAGPALVGDRCVVRALLGEADVDMGVETRLLRWMDAGGTVRAGRGSLLHGRVSAGRLIELADGCRFERLQAPTIVFGEEISIGAWSGNRTPFHPAELGGERRITVEAGRWLIRDNLELPPGAEVSTDLVITGSARLGAGVRVAGSVKSHKDLSLGRGVEIEGSAVSGRNLYLEEGCRIHGPVLAERTVRVERGCRIGLLEQPTTVSADEIRCASGSVSHGTVWAREIGLIEPEERGA